MDVNDEAPEFEVTPGCASVTEFHPPSEVVSVVRAHDRDDPSTPNGRLVFNIEAGNELGEYTRVQLVEPEIVNSRNINL